MRRLQGELEKNDWNPDEIQVKWWIYRFTVT